MPARGARRFFSTSTASARKRRDVQDPRAPFGSGGGSAERRSIAHRKAASVLPDPVGRQHAACSSLRRSAARRLAGRRSARRTTPRTRPGRRGRRSRGPRMNHATPSFGHRSCQTGLPDLGNGVDMEGSAALDAAKPPGREEPHAAVGLRVPPGGHPRRSALVALYAGRRGQGARRRAEPDPDDEASLRLAGASRRHQPDPRTRRDRGARRRAARRGAGPSQGVGRIRRDPARLSDDRGHRAADRRPARAQPREHRRLAQPRRSRWRPRVDDARDGRVGGADEHARGARRPDRRIPRRHVHDERGA